MGSLVLHVGQAKAASTSIQLALTAARPHLVLQGISYPDLGHRNHHAEACWFALNRSSTAMRSLPAISANTRRLAASADWEGLAASVRTSELTIVSSEYFSVFGPSLAAAAVDSLTGGHRSSARVVVVARPASRLLPSLYSQRAIDFALPSFETWVRMQLRKLNSASQLGSLPIGPQDSEWLAATWSQAAPVRVVDFDPPLGSGFGHDLFDALMIPDQVTPPVLGRANRSLCAARLIAWQRCLTPAGRPDNPGYLGRKIPFTQFDDSLLPGRGGRFALTEQAASLVDAAFPRPSPNGQPTVAPGRESARNELAQLVVSGQPITEVSGVDAEGLRTGIEICLQHLPFESCGR